MITHNLIQGSAEWHAYRAAHDNASDAPAMMGCSAYKTRDQLIAEYATGIRPEVDAATQRRFDAGHHFEKLALPLAQKIIGEDLYPCTGSVEGSRLSASFDGLTMLETVGYEHKTLNERLRAVLSVEGCTGADLPMEYQIQMEQQCAVSDCERILFVASAWDSDDQLIDEMHCWYTPNPALRGRILAGWEQFHKDVAAWVPPKATAVVKPTAKLRDALPVLVFDAKGEITASNVDEFKAEVLARINSIKTTLETDQDFADGETDAKWLREVSAGMKVAIQRVRSGMTSVNDVLDTLEQLGKLAAERANAVEKQVKSQKDSIKQAEVHRGQNALREHIAHLNAAMPEAYMPSVPTDFDGVVKNKRTLDSLRGAVNDELARAKIAASEIATRIHANLKTLDASGLVVHDAAALVLKAPDDLAFLIAVRKADEETRLERERERIRAEEAAKLQREADARARAEAAELQRQQDEAARAAVEIARNQPVTHAFIAPAAINSDSDVVDAEIVDRAPESVVQLFRAAPAPAERTGNPTLKLGTINERLGGVILTSVEGLRAVGFAPAATAGNSKLYHEADFPLILAALVRHIEGLQARAAA
ncbi:YqaJ viral recombinase family protein [Acidovorax sp. BL-A-41-H1]|uniref:YqaJ viral recombinase family protein n=1 Tax=Acidovorax sp. BL-A-41-H1 TaxID=3421102 RepID=UPI003F79844B